MSIFIFFLVLFVLILVHEWGHYITAKKTGMRVDEFGIGFPPKLFGIKKGETEYTFNALPIGGFVRIFGEDAEGARESNDFERSFVAKAKWKQAIVLIAGVAMNILFAWILFIAVFAIGVPSSVDENEASENARLMVSGVLPESPAAIAGLTPGVEIVSIEFAEMQGRLTPSTFSEYVSTGEGAPVVLTYKQGVDTEPSELTLVPESGLIAEDPNRLAIGVSLVMVDIVQRSLGASVIEATKTTYEFLILITVSITKLLADAVMFKADLSQVAGPVGIVGLVGEAAAFGLTSLLLFTATISLNLAVINMLPFPALDGGRLLFVAIESITRRTIDPAWVLRLNTVGFILLILLMVAVTYNDIVRLL